MRGVLQIGREGYNRSFAWLRWCSDSSTWRRNSNSC